MIDKYVTQDETGTYFLMIPLKSKKTFERASKEADQMANDILSCITIAQRETSHKKNPQFIKAITAISTGIWKIIKEK